MISTTASIALGADQFPTLTERVTALPFSVSETFYTNDMTIVFQTDKLHILPRLYFIINVNKFHQLGKEIHYVEEKSKTIRKQHSTTKLNSESMLVKLSNLLRRLNHQISSTLTS